MKVIIKAFAKFCFKLINVNLFFRVSQRLSYLLSNLTFFKDWVLMVNGRPQYYDHQLNLYKWIYNPGEWAFTARGVYARENMFPGCKVLDLCCGDGSYSYLFFSDIAAAIDAVDIDQAAINHAVKYYSSPNINYFKLDIINEKFPSADYDFVIWNAAICYFDITEIHEILNKIQRAGNSHMNLYGIAPVATGYVDHKTEFNDANELRELLLQYFTSVHIKQINEITINNIYFHAADPIKYTENK